MRVFLLLWFLGVAALSTSARAQEKKKEKTAPRVLVAIPLAVTPGQTLRLTLRGHHLDKSKEVKLPGKVGSVKIVNKGKSEPPDRLPEDKFGDTYVEIELKLDDTLTGTVNLTVVTGMGETKPYPLLVATKLPVVADTEANDGFREAQPVTLPTVVDGQIERPRDVDVFRFEGKAGQKIVAEILAARHGSALDGVLTLYSAGGNQVATSDDHGDSVDPRLETVLPADGVYYLALIDAFDTGGALHLYRMRLR